MMKITRTWAVFCPEFISDNKFPIHYDWTNGVFSDGTVRIVDIEKLGDTEVTVHITRETAEECEDEMWAQLDDGLFENYPVSVREIY